MTEPRPELARTPPADDAGAASSAASTVAFGSDETTVSTDGARAEVRGTATAGDSDGASPDRPAEAGLRHDTPTPLGTPSRRSNKAKARKRLRHAGVYRARSENRWRF